MPYTTVDANPMELLLGFLRRPDVAEWERLALSAVGGAFSAGASKHQIDAVGLGPALVGAVAGALAPPTTTGEPVAMAVTFHTDHGQALHCLLRLPADDELWTVLIAIDDSTEAVGALYHRARWQEYLQWSNVLQFLRSPGREALIGAASMGPEAVEGAWILDVLGAYRAATSPSGTHAAPVAVSPDMEEELDLLEDDEVRTLVRAALESGAPDFVAGYELDGTPVEAAWPDRLVGVLATTVDQTSVGSVDRWDLRTATGWTSAVLLEALGR